MTRIFKVRLEHRKGLSRSLPTKPATYIASFAPDFSFSAYFALALGPALLCITALRYGKIIYPQNYLVKKLFPSFSACAPSFTLSTSARLFIIFARLLRYRVIYRINLALSTCPP